MLRWTNEARSVSVQVKRIAANNVLSSFLGNPQSYPLKTLEVKDTTLAKLIAKSSSVIDVGLTRKEQKEVANLVSSNSKKIAEEQPEALIKLRNTIELAIETPCFGAAAGQPRIVVAGHCRFPRRCALDLVAQ